MGKMGSWEESEFAVLLLSFTVAFHAYFRLVRVRECPEGLENYPRRS